MFHKVVWQHLQGVVGLLTTTYCKFTKESYSENCFGNRLRFDRIMPLVCGLTFLAHPVYYGHTLV